MPVPVEALVPPMLGAGEVADFVPVLVMFLIAFGFAAGILLVSWLLGKKSAPSPVRDAAYECGMPPVTDAHQRFGVKFYLVAILFVLFDIEVVFLFPWAVIFRSTAPGFLLVEMLVFIGILFLGWFYVIRKGAVNWARDT